MNNFLVRSADQAVGSGIFGGVQLSPKLHPLANAAYGFIGASLGAYAAAGNEFVAAFSALIGAVAGYLLTAKIQR